MLAVAGVMLIGAGILVFGIAIGVALTEDKAMKILTPDEELAAAGV